MAGIKFLPDSYRTYGIGAEVASPTGLTWDFWGGGEERFPYFLDEVRENNAVLLSP